MKPQLKLSFHGNSPSESAKGGIQLVARTLEHTYLKKISKETIETQESRGKATDTAITAVSASASAGISVLGILGMDLLHPLLAVFQIFKLLNKLKFINISWGALIEIFQSQIANLFQLPGQEINGS